MHSSFDFSDQARLFDIALEILEDYGITAWSLGGGTTLSMLYYRHRLSYDIDIFIESFGEIQRILDHQEEIAANLGIDRNAILSSPTGVTFVLDDEAHGLKLDFVYSPALTSEPFVQRDVFDHSNIRVQTPLEIVAKKLKFREKATIRDFVDYAIAEEKNGLLSKLKTEKVVDMERYFDLIEKFDSISKTLFDEELRWLIPNADISKETFADTIYGLMKPKGKMIQVAIDPSGEVVAFDEFIPAYQEHYAPIGELEIYTIPNAEMDYRELIELDKAQIVEMASEKNAPQIDDENPNEETAQTIKDARAGKNMGNVSD